MDNKNSFLKDCELGIKQLIVKNVKKFQHPYNFFLEMVKLISKNYYFENLNDKTRNSPTSASYTTNKNSDEIEVYLIHMSINTPEGNGKILFIV